MTKIRKRRIWILAYPGTGKRTLRHTLHEEKKPVYGFYGQGAYMLSYFNWQVNTVEFEKFLEGKKSENLIIVDWCQNWKDVLKYFDKIFVYVITAKEYFERVVKYRATEHYREYDLKMLHKENKKDLEVHEYLKGYLDFLDQACLFTKVRDSDLVYGRSVFDDLYFDPLDQMDEQTEGP